MYTLPVLYVKLKYGKTNLKSDSVENVLILLIDDFMFIDSPVLKH